MIRKTHIESEQFAAQAEHGRGSLGRTPFLSQTDLLVSHDIRIGGSKRMRLEANVLNLFNQQTARSILGSVNRPRRLLPFSR